MTTKVLSPRTGSVKPKTKLSQEDRRDGELEGDDGVDIQRPIRVVFEEAKRDVQEGQRSHRQIPRQLVSLDEVVNLGSWPAQASVCLPSCPQLDPNPMSDAGFYPRGAHAFSARSCSQLLVLPQSGVEHRGALTGRHCVGEVFACSSCLERIAEPFVLGQRTLQQRPSAGRIALPEVQQASRSVDRWRQQRDRLAD